MATRTARASRTFYDVNDGNTVARFEVFIESANIPPSIATGSYNITTGVLTPPSGWVQGIPDGNINVWRAVGNLNTDETSGSVSVTFTIDSTVAYANGINGIVGNTSFQDIAFASNATGTTGFSLTPSDSLRYEGVYTYSASARQAPQSTTPTDYVWREIRVADSEVAAIQALVTYSNGLVFVRAPNNGDYTPAPVDNIITTRVDVTFQTDATNVLARVSQDVTYNTTTGVFSKAAATHPAGNLNVGRVTITPLITSQSIEASFAYSHENRQATTEAEVFLVQGGGVGPANIQRFRVAEDAGDAGRPTAASGLDDNWVDNPDLLEAGTLFESTQQVSVSQDGRPYSTDLVFAGTSGGAYQAAQPEIQTITVASGAQTSTNNPGSAEIIRFTPSGTPGTNTSGEVTCIISLASLPSTLTYDFTLTDGGAAVAYDFLVSAFTTAGAVLADRSGEVGETLSGYANHFGLDNNDTVQTVDLLDYMFLVEGLNDRFSFTNDAFHATRVILGDNYILTVSQVNRTEDVVWTAFSGFSFQNQFEFTDSTGTHYTTPNDSLTNTIRGAQTTTLVPYLSGLLEETESVDVVYESRDYTPALQAQRFVNNFPKFISRIGGGPASVHLNSLYDPHGFASTNNRWSFSNSESFFGGDFSTEWPTSGFIIIRLPNGESVSGFDRMKIVNSFERPGLNSSTFNIYDNSGATSAGTWGWRQGLSGGTNFAPSTWANLAGNRFRIDNTASNTAALWTDVFLGTDSSDPQPFYFSSEDGTAEVRAYRVGGGTTFDFVISSVEESTGTPPTSGPITASSNPIVSIETVSEATYAITGTVSDGVSSSLTLNSLLESSGTAPPTANGNTSLAFYNSSDPPTLEVSVGIEGGFTVSADGDDVVITGVNVGDVTDSLVLTTTQNTGNIMYTTPVVTEGTPDDNASDVTFRFEDDGGVNRDITIMFTSQLNANGIASAIETALEVPVLSTTAVLQYNFGIPGALPVGRWNFRNGTSSSSTVLNLTDWPTSGIIRADVDDPGGLYVSTTVPAGATLTIDDGVGNSAVYSISGISIDGTDENLILSSLISSTGVVPDSLTDTTFTYSRSFPLGFTSVASNNVVTITYEEDAPRAQSTVTNVDAGTNGNLTSGSFTIATSQDGIAPNTVVTGTRSSLVVNGDSSETVTIAPGTDLATASALIVSQLSEDTQEMYITADTDTVSLESYSRALGGDFNFTATFNPGDSSTASMVQENEVAGINEVHDGTQVRWSRAIQVGTIS